MALPAPAYQDAYSKSYQTQFLGLDHRIGARDGSLWDMENLTAFEHDFRDAFEVPLKTRYERAKLRGTLELGLTPRDMALLEPFVEMTVEESR